jgi:hypothetical protein
MMASAAQQALQLVLQGVLMQGAAALQLDTSPLEALRLL